MTRVEDTGGCNSAQDQTHCETVGATSPALARTGPRGETFNAINRSQEQYAKPATANSDTAFALVERGCRYVAKFSVKGSHVSATWG